MRRLVCGEESRWPISGWMSRARAEDLGALSQRALRLRGNRLRRSQRSLSVFPDAKERWHWSFPDPSRKTGTEEERLEAFRSVRGDLRERIEGDLLPN